MVDIGSGRKAKLDSGGTVESMNQPPYAPDASDSRRQGGAESTDNIPNAGGDVKEVVTGWNDKLDSGGMVESANRPPYAPDASDTRRPAGAESTDNIPNAGGEVKEVVTGWNDKLNPGDAAVSTNQPPYAPDAFDFRRQGGAESIDNIPISTPSVNPPTAGRNRPFDIAQGR
jgi:gas vesicle protein